MLDKKTRSGRIPIALMPAARGALTPSGDAVRQAPNGQPFDHRFLLSTDRLASDGGVILVDAWRTDAYLQRPRWIANHDIYGYAPINQVSLGRGVHVGIEDGLPANLAGPSGRGLVGYVRYASTPFAQEIKTLYEEGGLDDVSVRWDWRTAEERAPFQEEVLKYGTGLDWIGTRADLVEFSAVLLGADPGAQQLRGFREPVLEAFERARANGRDLPTLERAIRSQRLLVAVERALEGQESATIVENGRTITVAAAAVADVVTDTATTDATVEDLTPPAGSRTAPGTTATARSVDITAVQDVIVELDAAVDGLTAVHVAQAQATQRFTDAMTNLRNILSAAVDDAGAAGDAAIDAGADDGDDTDDRGDAGPNAGSAADAPDDQEADVTQREFLEQMRALIDEARTVIAEARAVRETAPPAATDETPTPEGEGAAPAAPAVRINLAAFARS